MAGEQAEHDDRVDGRCPMGCGETLFLGPLGNITCASEDCEDPLAVDTILKTAETEHIVRIGPKSFNVEHPLRERVDHALTDCKLITYLRGSTGPPLKPGLYRVTKQGKRDWRFTVMQDG